MTGAVKSSLARYSDTVLNVKVPKEACPFNLAPTASTTAMLALGDALAMTVLQARGFKEKDYARHHPSGAIGRALLMKVRDIMRAGERNAVAGENLTVKEALLLMCRPSPAASASSTRRGKLTGVFTDGDLRRHTAADREILARPLAGVMTRQSGLHPGRRAGGGGAEDFQPAQH